MLCLHFPTPCCRTNPSAGVQTTLYGTELQDDIYGNFCVKFSINLIHWPKHVHNVSLAQLRPLHVLLIFKNYTQSLSGMLRLMYGLLNCFEQSFKCSFITRRKQTNKQIKNNVRPEPVRKCQSGEKSKTRERPHLTRLSLEQSGPKIPRGLRKCPRVCTVVFSRVRKGKAQPGTEPAPDSSSSFANKALTFPAINFPNHWAVLACRSKAMQKLTSRFAALNCLQFTYGLCWHIVGEFVCHRRKKALAPGRKMSFYR